MKKCIDCKIEIQNGILCDLCEIARRAEYEEHPEKFGNMRYRVKQKDPNRIIIRRRKSV